MPQESQYQIVRNVDELERLRDRWSELCDESESPNPFYRPEFLLPVLRLGLVVSPVCVVFVRARPRQNAPLIGMFPFELRPSLKRPLATLAPLTSKFSFLRTPIVRANHVEDAFAGLCAALDNESRIPLLAHLQDLSEDGALARGIESARAAVFLQGAKSKDPVLTAGRRMQPDLAVQREYGGKWRKLSTIGALSTESATGGQLATLRQRLDEFLEMENGTWKGANGSSMKTPGFRVKFFDDAIRKMAHCGLITTESLLLDRRPIAIQINFSERREGDMLFGFKSTFDAAYAKYSPGAVLLYHQGLEFNERGNVVLFDSCTHEENHAVRRIWPDRVTRVNYYFGPNSIARRALVSGAMRLRDYYRRFPDREREVRGGG